MTKKPSLALLAMDAAIRGEVRFQGPPCKRCKSTWRYTSSTYCCDCTARLAEERYYRKRALIQLGRKAKSIESLIREQMQGKSDSRPVSD